MYQHPNAVFITAFMIPFISWWTFDSFLLFLYVYSFVNIFVCTGIFYILMPVCIELLNHVVILSRYFVTFFEKCSQRWFYFEKKKFLKSVLKFFIILICINPSKYPPVSNILKKCRSVFPCGPLVKKTRAGWHLEQ